MVRPHLIISKTRMTISINTEAQNNMGYMDKVIYRDYVNMPLESSHKMSSYFS